MSPARANAAPVIFSGLDNGVGPGQADPNSTAAEQSFVAAVPPTGVITFENLPLGTTGPFTPVPGVTVTTSGEVNVEQLEPMPAGQGYNTTPGGVNYLALVPAGGTASATFSFATSIDAFGFFLTGSGTGPGNLTVSFNDGTPESLTATKNDVTGGIAFYGFDDPGAAITSVTLTEDIADIVGIDDVRFQDTQAVPVPEPTGLAALGCGLLGLGVVRRRTLTSPRRRGSWGSLVCPPARGRYRLSY